MATKWKSIIPTLSSGKDKLLHRWYKIPLGKKRNLLASPHLWQFLREVHLNGQIIRRILWTDELLGLLIHIRKKEGESETRSYLTKLILQRKKIGFSISEIRYFYFHYFYKNNMAILIFELFFPKPMLVS